MNSLPSLSIMENNTVEDRTTFDELLIQHLKYFHFGRQVLLLPFLLLRFNQFQTQAQAPVYLQSLHRCSYSKGSQATDLAR